MAGHLLSLFISFSILRLISATVVPTAPGPQDKFAQGSPCTVQWNPDDSGEWNDMTIDLMSGSNLQMVRVANVASGLDGTDPSKTPFSWPCPEVTPYGAIYFYQFSKGDNRTAPTWTSRFLITDANDAFDEPEHSTQPDGESIPWGIGRIQGTKTNMTAGEESTEDDQDEATSASSTRSTILNSSAVTIPAPTGHQSAQQKLNMTTSSSLPSNSSSSTNSTIIQIPLPINMTSNAVNTTNATATPNTTSQRLSWPTNITNSDLETNSVRAALVPPGASYSWTVGLLSICIAGIVL